MAEANLSFQASREGAPSCGERSFAIMYSPVRVTGAAGRRDAITVQRVIAGAGSGPCYFNTSEGNLAAGTWRVAVSIPGWSTVCEVELQNGPNPVHFTAGRAGCIRALGYP